MPTRFNVIPAVFVAILKNDQVLLVKRKNTGFLDGFYDLPSGHLENGETIQEAGRRELKEETGLETNEKDLALFHICQNYTTKDRPYLFFMLRAKEWRGEPSIQEPDKTDDVGFFPLDNLPTVVPHVKKALPDLNFKIVTFGYVQPGEYDDLGQ